MSALELALLNLGAWSLQAAILVLGYAALSRLLPVTRPGPRLAIGQGLLATVVALPLLQPWRVVVAAESGWVAFAATPAGGGRSPAPAALTAGAPEWPLAVAALLALGVGLALARLVLGLAALRRLGHRARPLEPLPWLAALRAEVAPRARLAVTEDASTAVTFGLRRPLVLLPRGFASWPRERQAAVALHELLHVARRDWPLLLLEELATAVLFFHPAVHWLAAELRLAREQCVDAAVVRRLGGREAYLESLVEAARARALGPLAAAPFFHHSHLRERVALLLQEVPMSAARTLRNAAVTAAALVVAFALAASAVPLQAKPDPAPARVATADEVQATAPRIVKKVNPAYPADARAEGVEGLVVVDLTIGEDGAVRDARAVASAPDAERLKLAMARKGGPEAMQGDGRLAAAAVEAVRQWSYEPVLKDGKPVEVKATVTVNFRLS